MRWKPCSYDRVRKWRRKMPVCVILSVGSANLACICNWYRYCDLHDRGSVPRIKNYRRAHLKAKDEG